MSKKGERLFQPYARLKVPEDELYEFLRASIYTDKVDLPDSVDELNHTRINNTVHIKSVPTDNSIGDYTPTATIKGHVEESIVVVEEDGEITHTAPGEYRLGNTDLGIDDEVNTTTVKYIKFYGRGDEIIVHDLLRTEMFHVLCKLSRIAVKGYVHGVCERDNELYPVWYDHGYNQRDVQISVQEYENTKAQTRDPDGGEVVKTWDKPQQRTHHSRSP